MTSPMSRAVFVTGDVTPRSKRSKSGIIALGMPQTTTIEEALTLLAETPARIVALTSGLSPAQLRARPSPDEWSANDVLAHLRACADVRGGYILAMLAEDRPTLRARDPRTWMRKTDYPELEFEASFRAFATQRADLLAALEALPREDWSRSATVKGAGKTQENDVLFYAEWLIVHERPHIKQIALILERRDTE